MFRAHGKGVNNELIQLIKTSISLFRIQKFNKNLCEKERLDSKIQIFCLQFTWITILRGLQYQILKTIFFQWAYFNSHTTVHTCTKLQSGWLSHLLLTQKYLHKSFLSCHIQCSGKEVNFLWRKDCNATALLEKN